MRLGPGLEHEWSRRIVRADAEVYEALLTSVGHPAAGEHDLLVVRHDDSPGDGEASWLVRLSAQFDADEGLWLHGRANGRSVLITMDF